MKLRLSIFLVTLFCLGLFNYCKKTDDSISFDFSITVVDFYNETPISSVTVKAYTKGVSSGTYNNTFQLQASESTQNNGLATFEVPYGGIEVIKLSFEKEGYFNESVEFNPDDLTTEAANVITIPFKRKGVVSLRLYNSAPFSEFDEITFNTLNGDCDECTDFNSLVLTGTQIDTMLFANIVANRYFKYQYIVTKNGFTNNFLDSTLCSNDTTFIVLNY